MLITVNFTELYLTTTQVEMMVCRLVACHSVTVMYSTLSTPAMMNGGKQGKYPLREKVTDSQDL
jgi:hypothetical protein